MKYCLMRKYQHSTKLFNHLSLAIKFMKKLQLNNHSDMNKTKLRTANSLLRNIDDIWFNS